jgi:hypothetical protein
LTPAMNEVTESMKEDIGKSFPDNDLANDGFQL